MIIATEIFTVNTPPSALAMLRAVGPLDPNEGLWIPKRGVATTCPKTLCQKTLCQIDIWQVGLMPKQTSCHI